MINEGYNTNLASEYYVLSMLYRLGYDAYLTLGNKKSVDIIIDKGDDLLTIDVKGMAGTTNWPMENFKKKGDKHFIILVSFTNKINYPASVPEVYIVPSEKVPNLIYQNPKGTRRGITLSRIRTEASAYRDAWHLLDRIVK
ncbi:MAG: hypothetical protein MUO72_01750 [Bacteroidales bacterium]|nr:hypothetical protein [Bacteroidales bacterium]